MRGGTLLMYKTYWYAIPRQHSGLCVFREYLSFYESGNDRLTTHLNRYNHQYKNDNDFNEKNERLSYKQNALEGYLYTYIIYLQNTLYMATWGLYVIASI